MLPLPASAGLEGSAWTFLCTTGKTTRFRLACGRKRLMVKKAGKNIRGEEIGEGEGGRGRERERERDGERDGERENEVKR